MKAELKSKVKFTLVVLEVNLMIYDRFEFFNK